MATLTINGQRVKVDDSFLSMSPAEQEKAVEEIAASIGGPKPESDQSKNLRSELSGITQGFDGQGGAGIMRSVDSAMRGAADTASFGFADELSAGLGAATGLGGEFGDFSGNLHRQRIEQELRDQNDPYSSLIGRLGGAIGTGVGLAKGGLSLGANAVNAGSGLGRVAMASAADGAIAGGLYGAGSGEGLTDRMGDAAKGAMLGGAVGGAVPLATAGISAAAQPLIAPIMSRLKPQKYAEKALAEGVRRSGMSSDDIANALARSQADDQGMFTVADAMGHSGQRMLSTVARNPNNSRQTIADTLTTRQMGQGDRLSRTLAEGFGASDTAAQRTARLTAERGALANVNYDAARQGAGSVDISGALSVMDDILTPGVNRMANPGSGIADDSLEGIVRRAKYLLSDGKSQLTSFNGVLRAKQDIADMIGAAQRQGRNNQVRILSQINSELDTALEKASPQYRAANDAFRAQSRTIDAVETGTGAASGRTRAADNIRQFRALPGGEKSAFRAGYADPQIARVEAAAMSPTTNKARMLITEKTGQEFPAFAIPQRADKMGRRIAREQRMFETANTALGGSKTADNLADAAEMSKFDPGVMMNLLRGRPIQAAVDAVMKVANEAQGMPPQVLDRLAKALLETNPAVARAVLKGAGTRQAQMNGHRALANAILTNMGAVNAARAAR